MVTPILSLTTLIIRDKETFLLKTKTALTGTATYKAPLIKLQPMQTRSPSSSRRTIKTAVANERKQVVQVASESETISLPQITPTM
jgi:hypothetical protein